MIPLFSPVRQNEPLFGQIQEQLGRLLGSGEYILGPQVAEFEGELAQSLGYQHVVGCSSGTEALILSLKALDLPADSEVITPAFSFVASASAIFWAGLRPRLADVDLDTALMTPELAEKALTPKTRAIIAVDLYGRQVDLEGFRKLCDEKNLYLIEDGAQSIGVPNRGADFYTLSFYPTKNIGSIGDAGAVATDNPELAEKLKRLTQHGAIARDEYEAVGTNARLDTLHAIILNLKIPFLKQWSEKRREISEYYLENLVQVEGPHMSLPKRCENPDHNVWALFTLQLSHRDRVMEQLREKGVGCGIYYSKALSEHQAIKPFVGNASFPNATRLSQSVLSLPLFPELTQEEQESVARTVVECLSQTSM